MTRLLGNKYLRGFVTAIGVLAAAISCGPVSAQEAMALAIDGWTTQSGSDGVIYYRCASAQCAEGSVVSYKVQPHHPVSLEQFEQHHQHLAQQNKGSGRIRDVRVTAAKQREVQGVAVLQISRAVEFDDGTTTHSIEARLIGPSLSYSLVSDSPRAEWTANNFEGFLRPLVALAGVDK